MSMGGGGGGSNSTSGQFTPPDYTLRGWQDLVNNGAAVTQSEYQPYYGMTIAPINNTQVQGMQAVANAAGNMAPDYMTARAQNQLTAAGGYENPYSTVQTEVAYNPYMGAGIGGSNGEITLGNAGGPTGTDMLNPYTLGPDYGTYAFGRHGESFGQGGVLANPFLDISNPDHKINLHENQYLGNYTDVNPNAWTVANPTVGDNPYINQAVNVWQNPYMGKTTGLGTNKYEGQTTNVGTNPYADAQTRVEKNSYLGKTSDVGNNKFLGSTTNLDQNQYMGFGDAYQAMKQKNLGDIANAYRTGTAAQTDSAFNRVGAFHGGGHDAQISANEHNLGESLYNAGNAMDMQQWQNSGQLADAGLNRSLQAQQGDLGRNTQYTDSQLARYLQGQQTDYARNAGLGQDYIQLAAQTNLADAARNAQFTDAGLNRSMNAQQTDLARNADLTQQNINLGAQTSLADLQRNAQLGSEYQAQTTSSNQQDAARNVGAYQNQLQLRNQSDQTNSSRAAQYGFAGQELAANTQLADYARNAGLDEGALNRSLQAQTTDLGRFANLSESGINRIQNQVQSDEARNSALYESRISRDLANRNQFVDRNANLANQGIQYGLQAQQGDLNRASQYWDSERNRQVGALPLAMQGGQYDMGAGQALMSIGDAQRSYQQDMLNSQYNNFNQYQQFPYQMMDAFASILGRASGNYGSNTAVSQQNYQANPYAALLGGGLLGAGAYNAFGSP